ncbi:hypothetical protein K9M47_01860 [Candidatus Gracilibacteria bacterium]|nr:hypothetical protein [Candidatus Gracilibacteria bacterium]MCF7898399.1 hypothetical protein [Candidatus Paceibacterota bacterium]
MTIEICIIGGMIAAACGCGGRRENYDFVKMEAELAKKKTAQLTKLVCRCQGGTLEKKSEITRLEHTHHQKRELHKSRRETIHGMMTA